MDNLFYRVFSVKKPVIGMIHLSGNSGNERVKRAIEELKVYDQEGINGAIIEDYHGSHYDVGAVAEESASLNLNLVRGINILKNPYDSFSIASQFGAQFVQFDSIQTPDLAVELYSRLRRENPKIAVLGGVQFKYTQPTGNLLDQDLDEGMGRCDAIVTTGSGTGIETPVEKLVTFRTKMNGFPLIVGAGVELNNVREQLKYADGAIIGSYFKPNKNTHLPVDRSKVRELMNIILDIRKQ